MPLTSLLGTVDSRPGNTVFALGGSSSAPPITGTASNSLALAQSVTAAKTYERSVISTVVFNQVAAKTVSLIKSASSTLSLSGSCTGIQSKLASNTLNLSQSATYAYSRGARNTLALGDSVSREVDYGRELFSNLIAFQTIGLTLTVRRTVAQTLTFTQSATVTVARAISNTINFTQIAEGINSKGTSNALEFYQSASVNYTLNLPAESELLLNHSVSVLKSTILGASNAFGMNQFARGTKVISASANNTLVLSQDLVRERFDRTVSQTLTLAQSAVGVKHASRSVSQALALTHAVSVSKTYVRSVQHTFVFKNSFDRYIALNGGTTITVPAVQVVKVEALVILQSDTSVIVLKAPEFGDNETGANRINIKRSMNGSVRIYKRLTPTARLEYAFVMDRKKAIELRTFILGNNSKMLRMTNWKGEIWMVNLTNNPFSFSEEARRESSWGNRSSIVLEFEGVKIN